MLGIASAPLLADLALPVLLVGGAVIVIVLLLIVFVLLERSSRRLGAVGSVSPPSERASGEEQSQDVAGNVGSTVWSTIFRGREPKSRRSGSAASPAAPAPPAPPAPGSGALYSEWEAPEPTRSAPPPPPAVPPSYPYQSPPTGTPSPPPAPSAPAPADEPAEEAPAEAMLGAYDADDGRLRGITGTDEEAALDAVAPPVAPSAPPPAPAGPATAAQLQFTSYYPREVPPLEWQTLLVYAHVAEALAAVRADVARFADELGERPRSTSALATQAVERGTTLTLVPSCAGVRFNPERLSLSWDEDWQRGSFRFQAGAELAGSAAAGEIVVYVGPLILAVLKLGLLVSDAAQPTAPVVGLHQETTGTQSVFASYSHDDTPVVLACRNAYRALGLTVNLDVDSLRAGEHWGPRLMELIESSDIFQLFWSAHAAASTAVEREWRYALAHARGAGYIRPVYWEQPLTPPPPELADMHFAYVELPHS